MSRWKASFFHFLISLVVICVVAGLICWRWYPPGLFGMAKAGTLLAVLAGVDLVLGPLLTAIVFRAGKPGLKFDLAVIALLQVAALSYGLHTLWISRPAYIVAISNQFRLVFANEIEVPSAEKAPPPYRSIPVLGAKVVAAPLPTDPKARAAAIFESFSGGEIFLQPSRYVPYPPAGDEPLRHAVPAAKAISLAPPAQRAEWQEAFGRHREVKQLAMLPLQSSRGSASVLLDAADGRILRYVGLDPWPIIDAVKNEPETAGH
jgi:hypothetical protein